MFTSIIFMIILINVHIQSKDAMKTTQPVSIVLDGITIETWIEQSLWNKTRLSIVHHLNEFCKKDYHCDAEYGIENIHLLSTLQYSSSSIQLNLTADEPVLSMYTKNVNGSSFYNYTALLTGALFQAKIDTERFYDNQLLFFPHHTDQNKFVHRTSRILCVLLGVTLVAIIFGLTVFFFQRIRRHSYSKLLKGSRMDQLTQDETLVNSSSMSTLRQ